MARRAVSKEEARQILKRAVASPERLGDLFVKVFGPDRGADLELSPVAVKWRRRVVFPAPGSPRTTQRRVTQG